MSDPFFCKKIHCYLFHKPETFSTFAVFVRARFLLASDGGSLSYDFEIRFKQINKTMDKQDLKKYG
ncbi:MAG: hypothetical protein K2H25_00360, partial [Alistipes sp.]|nr:hypothetical protein [Alistipes sp.]